MAVTAHLLASGPGWRVSDFICDSGPHDRRFEEQHQAMSIALVSAGTFQYRTRHGTALLAPGSILLGNDGQCFECGHEHATGDRCLSFRYDPAHLEEIAADIAGARRGDFNASHLPPLTALAPLAAAAEAARDEADGAALEEMSLRLAGAVMTTLAGGKRTARRVSTADERRVTGALRRIEAATRDGHNAALSVRCLARDAGMSAYHFLRVFRQVAGTTPHQFVLRMRLHRAALRLRRSSEAISAIAFDCGFGDLSTFNHRFRRIMGVSPGEYRARRA
jgi:AraC-like DNA-binding protein